MNRFIPAAGFVLSSSSLLLIDATAKGVVVLLIAACAALLLRRDSAATRHLIWLVAIVVVLIVPVFSTLLPAWRVLPEWAMISTLPAEQVSIVVFENTANTTFVPNVVFGEQRRMSTPIAAPSTTPIEPQSGGQVQTLSLIHISEPTRPY